MELKKLEENGKITIEIVGSLDSTTAPELGEALAGLSGVKELVFDFDKVDYMSSAGIREVLSAYRKCKSENAAFSVKNVNKEVLTIFEMTGLSEMLPISGK